MHVCKNPISASPPSFLRNLQLSRPPKIALHGSNRGCSTFIRVWYVRWAHPSTHPPSYPSTHSACAYITLTYATILKSGRCHGCVLLFVALNVTNATLLWHLGLELALKNKFLISRCCQQSSIAGGKLCLAPLSNGLVNDTF